MPEIDGNSEDKIRERAFLLWEAAGCPEARADEFWARARADEFWAQAQEAETSTASVDIVEAAGGHYPPTSDSENFA